MSDNRLDKLFDLDSRDGPFKEFFKWFPHIREEVLREVLEMLDKYASIEEAKSYIEEAIADEQWNNYAHPNHPNNEEFKFFYEKLVEFDNLSSLFVAYLKDKKSK